MTEVAARGESCEVSPSFRGANAVSGKTGVCQVFESCSLRPSVRQSLSSALCVHGKGDDRQQPSPGA